MLGRKSRSGFTLVEVLIVVTILGTLAAIVVPQFQNVNEDSKKAALSQQLNRIREQIQFYTLQHKDVRPDLASGWDDLLTRGAVDGQMYGPYLSRMPRNPLNQFTGVVVVNSDPPYGSPVVGANIGFVYNIDNGFLWGTNTAGDKVYNEVDPADPNN